MWGRAPGRGGAGVGPSLAVALGPGLRRSLRPTLSLGLGLTPRPRRRLTLALAAPPSRAALPEALGGEGSLGGRAAHQLPQSVLLSLHVPAEARPRLKARTSVRKSMVGGVGAIGDW